jgi:NADH:ubiquinone oxidoreductase subunit K
MTATGGVLLAGVIEVGAVLILVALALLWTAYRERGKRLGDE